MWLLHRIKSPPEFYWKRESNRVIDDIPSIVDVLLEGTRIWPGALRMGFIVSIMGVYWATIVRRSLDKAPKDTFREIPRHGVGQGKKEYPAVPLEMLF